MLSLLRRSTAFPVRFACAALGATAAAVLAQTPSAADGFDPNVDGNVYVLATQPDGKLLVGGQFSVFRTLTGPGITRNNVARLNPDGSVDDSFNPNANGPVRALLLQPDGKIVVGGDFTSLQPGAAAVTRNRLARLNADGTVDATFNPNLSGTFTPQVYALVLQPDGRIVAGGSFSTVQANGAATATTRNGIARFNANGSIDAGYDPNPNGMVLALALHVDGKIVVGGGFSSFQASGDASAMPRNRIARLNPAGTVDSDFDPNANNGVTSLAVQRDGKILLGGYFTTLQPVGNDSPSNCLHLARLNVDGTLDSDFYPSANGNVMALAMQPDGAILAGGSFASAWGRGSATLARGNVARFNPDGALDPDFNPNANALVGAFAFQPDGKLVIGGSFTGLQPSGTTTASGRNHLARLNADGSLDADFELNPGGRTLASVVQSDGKIVIGGSFTSVSGAPHNYLARLNADGTVDRTYAPDLNGHVLAMAIQSDGKVLVGGTFTTIGGETHNHFARLNPSGTVDSEFNPNVDGQVGTIALQSDGGILIGGSFANLQPIGALTATVRANIARLTAAGQLDATFNPTANAAVSAIAVQSDGKILLGGPFTALAPNGSTTMTARNHFARVNSDGTLDPTYDPNCNGQISAIVVQSDGKAVVGGAFTALLPAGATTVTTRNRIARINADGTVDTAYDPNATAGVVALALQSDGKLVVGGLFIGLQPNGAPDWTLRKYAARLNPDGTIDPAFDLDLSEQTGNRVDSLRVQADGKIFVGGIFTSLQPGGSPARVARKYLVRINANGTLDATFDAGVAGSTGGQVNALAVQLNGKIVAVGAFADLGGAKTTNIARFNSDGTPDATFSTTLSTDGTVNAVIARPNGAVVALPLSGFAWLNGDGSLRSAFAPADGVRISGQIKAVAVQGDGSVILGGAFADLSNTTSGNLLRFSARGALDASFAPTVNGAVSGIAVQADGQIIIVGAFTLVNGTIRNRIARIDADGSLDVTYDPNASGAINAVVIQSDGNVVVGGAFTTVTPNGDATPTNRTYLARINASGSVDANYNPTPNATVNALTIQGDDKVIAGGLFTGVQPNGATTVTTRNYAARFNTDGSLDANFDPNVNGPVNALVVQPNGQIILGGAFTTLQPYQGSITLTRDNIARVNSDGTLDVGFDPNTNAAVTTLALQSDGAVVLGGDFTTLQPNDASTPVIRNRLARVNSDGSLDPGFNPGVNGAVSALAARPDGTLLVSGGFTGLQPNGLLMVGGSFGTIGGIAARNLAVLDDDGSVNPSFQPRPDGAINALLALPDGRTIVGGAFTNITGTARNRVARFNANGTLDASFNPNVGGTVNTLALQSDGRILIGGFFTTIGGQARTNLARINVDGSLDLTFESSATGLAVRGIAIQPDGRILILSDASGTRNVVSRLNPGGAADTSFTSASGGADAITAIALQTDGKLLVGGAFAALNGTSSSRLARLNPNGQIDGTFNPAPNGAVTALALQSDGKLMIGGGFTSVGGTARSGIARLAASSPATQVLTVTADRTTVIWSRTGTAGELSAVIFEQSSDLRTWTSRGEGRRVANGGNWQLSELSLPANGLFYLRARGITPSSTGTSSGLYQSAREFNYASPVAGIISSTGSAQDAVADFTSFVFDSLSGIVANTTPADATIINGVATTDPAVGGRTAASAIATSRLADLSARGRVAPGTPLIVGFAVAGPDRRSVLVRAVGPGLRTFGVTDALAATRLQLYDATGALILTNEGWNNSAPLLAAFAQTGAFPLSSGSADSAALVTLVPGNYTLQVIDPRGAGGVALAEIYDAGSSAAASRIVNVSSRGDSGSGSGLFVGGFVISGDAPKRLLLRGAGPALAGFGATGTVADPILALFDSQGLPIAGNDDWGSNAAEISAAGAAVGAFPFAAGSKDAALLATLPPGTYTVQVSGAAGTSGAVLLEIYELP